MKANVLYYGDNLDILERYIPDGSGRKSDAQLLAFEDTWHWGPSAEDTDAFLTNTRPHGGRVPESVSPIVGALRAAVRGNQRSRRAWPPGWAMR
ncbi:MAG TPA: hypothetical protein VNF71_14470 [Acidimicrobiales bacterium]|nr:hypothetical protein [Acidimicrobiales bacterium]